MHPILQKSLFSITRTAQSDQTLSMAEQPEDEVRHRSKKSDRGKTSPWDDCVSVYIEFAVDKNLQSVEEEGQVRVELAPLCTFDVFVDPRQERRTCECGDHNHVRSNPSEDDICPRVPVTVSLFGSSISRFLLGGRRVLEGTLGSHPECVNVFLHGGQINSHHFLAILALHFRGSAEIFGSTIVALGAPRNIM